MPLVKLEEEASDRAYFAGLSAQSSPPPEAAALLVASLDSSASCPLAFPSSRRPPSVVFEEAPVIPCTQQDKVHLQSS